MLLRWLLLLLEQLLLSVEVNFVKLALAAMVTTQCLHVKGAAIFDFFVRQDDHSDTLEFFLLVPLVSRCNRSLTLGLANLKLRLGLA